MTQTENKPIDTIRYGTVQGSIWKHPGSDGKPPFYKVRYETGYRDKDDNWKNTSSFSESENLKLEVVRRQVADRIVELKDADRNAANDPDDAVSEAA